MEEDGHGHLGDATALGGVLLGEEELGGERGGRGDGGGGGSLARSTLATSSRLRDCLVLSPRPLQTSETQGMLPPIMYVCILLIH